MKSFSYLPSENNFHHEIILLKPWIPLAPVALSLHKMIIQKPTHYSSASEIIKLLSPAWKLTSNIAIFVEGSPPIVPINVLGWCTLISGCVATFVVLVFFSGTTTIFLTKKSLWFPRWFFSVGCLWVTWTSYDINNSLTSGLKLLSKVADMSNGNTTSCMSASYLNHKLL